MLRSFSILTLSAVLLADCASQPDIRTLEADLQTLVDSFDGRAGIFVRRLDSGVEIAINADSLFPTASMVKVPILLKTFDLIDRGELAYQQEMIYMDSLYYSDEDLAGNLKDSAKVKLSALVMLMLTMSDNTASLWLQETAGTGTAINEWLSENGFESTRVNSRTEGRRPDWERYGWGQTTPREMAGLIRLIYEGRAVSPPASEEMYRILTRTYWNDEAVSALPPTVQAATKQGAVSQSKSEVILVNAPSGDYLFCVITDDQTDVGYERRNEGYILIRNVSRLLWQAFEPGSDWTAAEGSELYIGPY